MKRIHTLAILATIVCQAWAYDVRVDDINYNLDAAARTAVVCGCSSRAAGISIPQQIEVRNVQYHVTAIADSAFYGNGVLAGVDIAPSVQRIGTCAFRDCSRLSYIEIPASVHYIGTFAFRGCTSLPAINVDQENTYYTSLDGMLYDRMNRTLMQCPASKQGTVELPFKVREVAPYAFYRCTYLQKIVTGNGVERIGEHAFDYNNSLVQVVLGTGTKKIGTQAFDHCKQLKKLYCHALTPPDAAQDAFDYEWMEFCQLLVPPTSVRAYQDAKPWRWFLEVVAMSARDMEDAISDVSTTRAPVRTYTIQGIPYTPGLGGIRLQQMSDGTTRKVLPATRR